MKRRIILITVVGILLLALPLGAKAGPEIPPDYYDYSGTLGPLSWALRVWPYGRFGNTGSLTISGSGDMPDLDSDSAWKNIINGESEIILLSVTIENGVTSIGKSAFKGCLLTDITIPDSIISIGENAIEGCGLGDVYITIPDSVISIGDNAFELVVLRIPNCNSYAHNWAREHNIRMNILHHSGQEVIDAAAEPSCTEAGITEGKHCSVCNEILVAQEEIPALRHDLVHHEANAATCTEIGWEAYDTCSRCDYTNYKGIPALGHVPCATPTDLYPSDEVLPTCTKTGLTRTIYCGRCGAVLTPQEVIPALGHDIEHHDGKAATCTEIGWNAYDTCKRDGCDYTTYVEIPALGHDLEHHDAQVPTDTESGWAEYDTCKRDSCNYTTQHILTSDMFFRYSPVPTCTTDGVAKYFCEQGDSGLHLHEIVIPALGHDLEHHEAKAPTCTEIGWDAYDTCSRCDYSTYVEKPALGHDLEHHEAEAPTCTAIGWDAYDACSRCDYTTYVEKAALGHDLEHHEAKAVTCTEVGWEAYDTCKRDGCEYSTKVEIPALGHDLEHHEAQAPTDTEAGWSEYDTCKRDGCNYNTKHILTTDMFFCYSPAPTCTSDGIAKYVCEEGNSGLHYHLIAIEALGHDIVHHEAKVPSCTEVGWDEYDTCSRCDYTTYVEKPALGHDVVHHEAQAPTCTAVGWGAYDSCSRCEYSTKVEIPALGHDWDIDYFWTANNSKVEAVAECNRCDHTETEAVDVTSVIVSPAENTEGSASYTSGAFSKEVFTVQTKNIRIPALKDMSVMHLPSMLSVIEEEAFSNLVCQAIFIPDGCREIGSKAFAYCKKLKYFYIPASVSNIAEDAFEGCSEELVIERE